MIFGQLMECNMRNIFLGYSYTKRGGETVPSTFLKNQNWACLWISSLKFYTVYFHFMPRWGPSKYIETKPHTLLSPHTKLFQKTKKLLELLSLSRFLHDFWRKQFFCYILLLDQILLFSSLYFMRYWVVCVL